MIVTVANTKGGVGKTTTVIFLATAFGFGGRVRVLDADPQGSASEWAERARDDGSPLPFSVEPVNLSSLRRLRDVEGVITIIDTPPGDAATIKEACARADVTVIPTAASGLDMERTWETYHALEGLPRVVLITNAEPRTVLYRQVIEALDEADAARFETVISKRQAVKDAYGEVPVDLFAYDTVAAEIREVCA